MARITVEDCLERISNRFDLVLVAARRAHMLQHGSKELLSKDNDKPAVLALREIAAGKVTLDILEQPMQPPEDEINIEDLHRQAAEMVVEEVSSVQDDDEDFDEEFDAVDGEGAGKEDAGKVDAGKEDAGKANDATQLALPRG